jgi:hypothetical protein
MTISAVNFSHVDVFLIPKDYSLHRVHPQLL